MIPKAVNKDNSEEIFHLMPTEGMTKDVKEIELPVGIIPKISDIKQLKSEEMFKKMLQKLSKANICRSKDGFITIGSRLLDTKFDDFIVDCCNGEFHEKYESIYCIFRSNGITF